MYTYTINLFKFTMTRKGYFKAQNVLSSPIPPVIKDRIILTPAIHIYKVVISVCLLVTTHQHGKTAGPICPFCTQIHLGPKMVFRFLFLNFFFLFFFDWSGLWMGFGI